MTQGRGQFEMEIEKYEEVPGQIAKKIIENEESIADFGCSDCKCHSHLIYFKNSN